MAENEKLLEWIGSSYAVTRILMALPTEVRRFFG
jgi:hypothetical protein